MAKDVELNTAGLEAFMRMLKKLPTVQVGVFGDGRNARVGAAHEFGTDKLPVRSWLRMPIAEQMPKRLKSAAMLNRDAFSKMMREGSIMLLMKKIALLAEDVVLGAFDTGGYGRWKPSDMRYKRVQQTLVETKQLRDGVTSRVVEG